MATDKHSLGAGELFQQIVLQQCTVGDPDTRGKPSVLWPDSLTAASWSAGVATFTVLGPLPATFVAGVTVVVAGCVPAAWDGTYTVTAVLSATRFRAALTADPGTATKLGPVHVDPAPGTLIRCKVENVGGNKVEISRQYAPTATHLITIRYRPIDEIRHRLVYKLGRVFNIGHIDDVEEKHVKLELYCREMKPEGAR
jgi:head-tail adaptor